MENRYCRIPLTYDDFPACFPGFFSPPRDGGSAAPRSPSAAPKDGDDGDLLAALTLWRTATAPSAPAGPPSTFPLALTWRCCLGGGGRTAGGGEAPPLVPSPAVLMALVGAVGGGLGRAVAPGSGWGPEEGELLPQGDDLPRGRLLSEEECVLMVKLAVSLMSHLGMRLLVSCAI